MEAPKSIAVFLGPSLPQARAAARLDASYYPPARMGDVYRLVASGVRIIVLVDGVFHGASAVWHRELLEAMAQGIVVIGASSMGALRASELHTLGMIGVGTIFEQYRDGVIDGDDEVALLHADASDGYRALSQPLVSIRHRLWIAVARGDLTPDQAGALTAYAKAIPFMWRTHARLSSCEVVAPWPASTRRRLQAVFDDPALDLKARDAERALEEASAMLARGELPLAVARPAPSRFYRAAGKRKRGLLHPEGRLVSGEALWDEVSAQQPLVRRCLAEAATRFYLCSLAEHMGERCPDADRDAFVERWDEQHGDWLREHWLREHWLRANGLTEGERRELLERRAVAAWMLERGPSAFGLDFSLFSRLPRTWRAAESCFVAAWARLRGIACPEPVLERLRSRLDAREGRATIELEPDRWRTLATELASAQWVVHEQPYRFGHTGWSPITAVLEELQITGRAARIVAERL